ncbi:ATP-dependent DNA helicase 2 subunit [Nymphaea thermarum]|nr:ATP-dependent DNA helicase 2 subunit [Nymphaea thermarum]
MLPEQKEQAVNELETLVNSSLDNTISLDNLSSSSQPNDPPIDNRFSGLVYSRRSVSTAAPRKSQRNEVTSLGGQVEPPGMHMIYLPFSDDIRHVEELQMDDEDNIPHATDDQVKSATSLLKRVDLRDFSVCQFANPALQRHYAILQALALGEDEDLPDVKDETMPDEEGMSKPGIVSALDAFKVSVYGENHDLEEATAGKSSTSEASKKRKAVAETAAKESSNYDWPVLADSGKLKDLTVSELKYYLTAHNLPVAGKKEALVSRILAHLGK